MNNIYLHHCVEEANREEDALPRMFISFVKLFELDVQVKHSICPPEHILEALGGFSP